MNKKINFEIDKFELLNEANDAQLAKIKMYIVRDGNNCHNIPITVDAIKLSKDSLVGKPILCKYNKHTDSFMGHEFDEIPVGVVLSKDDIYEEEIDGRLWLIAEAYIWKVYFPEVIRVFEKKNNESSISMEILILEDNENTEGQSEITLFSFLGVTLIGVKPAIPNAKAIMFSFSEMLEETKKIVYCKESSKSLPQLDIEYSKQLKEYTKFLINKSIESKDNNKRVGEKKEMVKNIENKTLVQENSIVKMENQDLENTEVTIAVENKELTDRQKYEIIDITLDQVKYYNEWCECEESRYYLVEFDNEYIYVEDYKEGWCCYFRIKYIIDENKVAHIDFESRQRVIHNGFTPVGEEKTEIEKKFEDVKEDIKEEFNTDSNLEPLAIVARSEEETEGDKEIIEEAKEEKMAKEDLTKEKEEMAKKFKELTEKFNELEKSNNDLLQFKNNILEQQKIAQIEFSLSEVSDIMPKDAIEEWKNKVSEFSDIQTWSNALQANAFKYVKNNNKQVKENHIKIGLPVTNETKSKENSKDIWASIRNKK